MRKALLILVSLFCLAAVAQQNTPADGKPVLRKGRNSIRIAEAEFYKTPEARRIGDQVLLWQRCTGGWPKNIDMAAPMTDEEKAKVLADKSRKDDSTTDNDATSLQMIYLARLYQATGEVKYRDAFRKGVEYLLSGQYKNGGWPQFWPEMRGYQVHITFNDDAMVNTMEMLRDMYEAKAPFGGTLCDPAMKKRLKKAFDKGVECILATQIKAPLHLAIDGTVSKAYDAKKGEGELTVWCQQNDRETLLPAKARAYELPAYCTQESAWIVRLLMQLPNPDNRVKAAIHAAMAWFDKYKLTGLRYRRILVNGKWQAMLEKDPKADTPIWARYYDLNNTLPYVCDRDGIPRRNLEDIGEERRNGYAWYGTRPAELYPMYEAWADKYDPQNKVKIDLHSKGANENGTIILGVQPKVNETLFDAIVKRGESIQEAIDKAPTEAAKGAYYMTQNIIDSDIAHAYKAQPELAKGKNIDPCPWGHRVYYIGCHRDGGDSGWLRDNVGKGEDAPTYYSTNATWTFQGKWDPEKTIRDLWEILAY